MIKRPLIWIMCLFDFIGWFSNYVAFDEIKWLRAFTKKYAMQKFIKKQNLIQWVDIRSI